MSDLTAEQFAHRIFDVNLLDERELDSVWGEFGTRNIAFDDFRNLLLRKELLTNFQVEKLLRGDRSGYFYGDYKVLYLVGTGTFARVFRAVNIKTKKVVAVKVLRRRWSEDPKKTEQFLREGQMGTNLRHIGIVPIYEVHSVARSHFLVMEFVEGQNLRHFVRVREKVEPLEAVKLMIDVCGGLAHAFDRGVSHRDLKLSNILVSSRGRARLVDFGLAGIGEGAMLDENLADFPNPRTIDYAALERVTGVKKDDRRSDVYFTGCIFYHLLTGKAPLRETKDRLQRMSLTRFEEIVPIVKLEPKLPVPVMIVANKAMELNPTKRYQTPGEMLADLEIAKKRLEEAVETGEDLSLETLGTAEAEEAMRLKTARAQAEGDNLTVMIVESDVEMQNLLRDQLKKHGYRVLVFNDPSRALARFQDQHVADCVLFCADNIGTAALEAYNDFGRLDRTRRVPAVLLLGKKQAAWESQVKTGEHRRVLAMPVGMKAVRAAMKDAMANAPTPAV